MFTSQSFINNLTGRHCKGQQEGEKTFCNVHKVYFIICMRTNYSQTFHIVIGKDVIFADIFSIPCFIFLITVQRVFLLKSGSWATHTINNLE